MKSFSKALIGTAAATAMAVSAIPANAKDGRHDDDGISAGDVIAGAVILGGLAAILTSGKDRDDRYDYRRGDRRHGNYGYGYNEGHGSRAAVERCVRRAENWASRYGNARVTQIRDIDRKRNGYKIKGNIVVNDGYRGGRYGNRHGNYGYRDSGKFTCYVEWGRVTDIKYSGLDDRGYNYRY